MLRKDFTVQPGRRVRRPGEGADAVLLIAAALSYAELVELAGRAAALGLDALVEVHDEDESERALAGGAGLVGVNQRDLGPSRSTTSRPARRPRASRPVWWWSPSRASADADDARRLAEGGNDAILVGETLGAALRSRPASPRSWSGIAVGTR